MLNTCAKRVSTSCPLASQSYAANMSVLEASGDMVATNILRLRQGLLVGRFK
jgi:hypothetical protein